MNENSWPQKVLILHEYPKLGDFDLAFQEGFEANGCQVDFALRTSDWDHNYDFLLAYGPFTSDNGMVNIGNKLLNIPPEKRPIFAWWLTENPPTELLPISFIKLAAAIRIAADKYILNGEEPPHPSILRQIALRGHRIRIIGGLLWMKKNNLLDVLVTTSKYQASYLKKVGLNSLVIPLGYHEIYGNNLELKRDIDVLFLGNASSSRRRRLLPPIIKALEKRGLNVIIRESIYDDARTKLLNRCKVMVNILRAPQDYVGQRFLLGAANKTLIVTEPVNDSFPFKPNKHIVISPIEDIPETIHQLIKANDKRNKITDAAYRFATQKLSSEYLIYKLIHFARDKFHRKNLISEENV